MGAEGIKALLKELDLEKMSRELRKEVKEVMDSDGSEPYAV